MPNSNTRENKKAQVRERIIAQALKLFERQGYERTTINEIAVAAKISTRTFFRYFPSKDMVIFPTHDAYIAHFRHLLKHYANDSSPMETVSNALRHMAKEYMAAADEHLRYQRIIGSSDTLLARSVAFDWQWEEAIADVWKRAYPRTPAHDRRAAYVAGAIMGAVNALTSMWYAGGCRQNLLKWGETTMELLAKGIGGDPSGKK